MNPFTKTRKMTPTTLILLILTAVLINTCNYANAWSQQSQTKVANKNNNVLNNEASRRGFFINSYSAIVGTTTAALIHPESAFAASKPAASSPDVKSDKENIVKGYKRLNYLLTNWEKETTICGRTDNPYIGCERTPEIVMDYLGFKSMNDPLFRIDKAMIRLQPLVSGTDDEIDYIEVMDAINQAVEDGNGIAFVSSWGEANPGGGKDRIDIFIERSKRYVETTRDGLGIIIKMLDLKVE